MLEDTSLSIQARKYVEMKREEELTKMRACLNAAKAEAARQWVVAEWEARSRAAEVEAVAGKRVPPPPLTFTRFFPPPQSATSPTEDAPPHNMVDSSLRRSNPTRR
jgi:hypothetical protein